MVLNSGVRMCPFDNEIAISTVLQDLVSDQNTQPPNRVSPAAIIATPAQLIRVIRILFGRLIGTSVLSGAPVSRLVEFAVSGDFVSC